MKDEEKKDEISKEELRKKIDRMRARSNKVRFLLYPEDRFKEQWDMFITMVLLISLFITPMRIAFGPI